MGGFASYNSAWVANAYVEVRPEEFSYNPERGELARAQHDANDSRIQTAGTTTVATDDIAVAPIDERFGQDADGFPETFWDPFPVQRGDDEGHPARVGNPHRNSRHDDDGSPAHRLHKRLTNTASSETFSTATEYDTYAYLLPDPTGPDAQRLISGGPGAFNSYASKNSFARKPMETFVREDRYMFDPVVFHEVRPLIYNRAEAPKDVPFPGSADGGSWGHVYSAWDTFTPEYLAEAPWDRVEPPSATLSRERPEDTPDDLMWGW